MPLPADIPKRRHHEHPCPETLRDLQYTDALLTGFQQRRILTGPHHGSIGIETDALSIWTLLMTAWIWVDDQVAAAQIIAEACGDEAEGW